MPGLDGVSQLHRLQQRVKYPAAQRLIGSAIETAARRLGLSRDDLDDLAAPTFGLEDGRLRAELGGCAAEIVVVGTHEVNIRWFTADGAPRRSEPAELKRALPDELKALKRTAEDLRKMLPAQRDRIERLLLTERSWGLLDWRQRYLDHPLLSVLARRLIWWFQQGEHAEAGAWRDGRIVGADDRPLDGLTDQARVRLWHPIGCEPEAVLGWRRWLERHAVTQPFKQAHREIYVLTDAELATETYSNRFAAHLLRQHQFQALCRQRGWTYRLQGAFDSHNTPTLERPRWGLRAEFWVEGLVDGDDLLSDAGICLYVSTDHVRFTGLEGGGALPLAEVPAPVFSEVMRDVDLFVGVCSVGNDPNWRDDGLAEYRNYWETYSFGDLSASAETRRAVLERLLPRLKIGPRCSLTDRFLVVRGDLRTYNIHLGSANVQMEPNSQYLCIVPDRSRRPEEGYGQLALPFEGDGILSLILSKAFLLADDTRITDPSILAQLRRSG
jgi:hypothetical protein